MNNYMVFNYNSVEKKHDSIDNHKSGPEKEEAGVHVEKSVCATPLNV